MKKFINIYKIFTIILLNLVGIIGMMHSMLLKNGFDVPAGDIFIAFIIGTLIWILCNLVFLIPFIALVALYSIISFLMAISPIIIILVWIAELLGSTTGISDVTFVQQASVLILCPIGILNLWVVHLMNEEFNN